MVIINAYLGAGSGSGVPVGKCLLNVAWNPSDGNNKSGATVSAVIGSTTVTGTTDASGNVSLLVGTGTCTVTVTPTAGSYTATSATVTAESTTTKTVVISGQAGRKVTLVVPYTLTTTSWNIKDSGNTQKASGSGAFNDKEVTLLDGSYTLSITAYGVTKTKTFTVSSTSTRIDCTDITCVITIRLPRNLATTITLGGVALSSNQAMVCVLRNSSALSYSGTVTTQLDGSAIATVTSSTITPSGATATLTPTVTGSRKLITATKTLNIPVTGHYKVFLIGGGGGGQGNSDGTSNAMGGGGGGGYMVLETLKVTSGNYTVTIGAGGAINTNGGATSFGSLLSVSGGGAGGTTTIASDTGNFSGGSGGSGGGAGSSNADLSGGHATFGGGGGSNYNSTGYAIGGSGGIFGGAGSKKNTAGSSGKAMQNADGFFSSTGSGYGGGASGTGSRGGGGGGGYGAKGGQSVKYGGGGGGGIAGGNGGDGNTVGSATHGLGYGSGGAGGTGTNSYNGGGGGGGGLYNIAQSGNVGANGACIIMWVG